MREMENRNAIMRGLVSARKGDIIMISDADEIPMRSSASRGSFRLIFATETLW